MAVDHATLLRNFLVRLGSSGNILATKQLDMHYVYSLAVTGTEVYIAGERRDPAAPSNIQYATNKYDLNGVEIPSNWKRVQRAKALYVDGANIWTVGEFVASHGGIARRLHLYLRRWQRHFRCSAIGGCQLLLHRSCELWWHWRRHRHRDLCGRQVASTWAGSFASPTIDLGADTLTNSDSPRATPSSCE